MKNDSENYDLVLVVEYFRATTVYLSVIKSLALKFSIGIYQVEIYENDAGKNDSAQVEFVNECVRLGANEIISKTVETKVLLIPQRPLNDNVIHDLHERFNAKTTVLLLGFAFAGLKKQDAILECFNFKKVYAVDKEFLDFLLKKRGGEKKYKNIDIVEVGLPYGKYSVLGKFSADYILAIPTPFSFPYELDKWKFLNAVEIIISKIDVNDVIVHKPHNGSDRDQFSSPTFRAILKKLKYFPGSIYLIKLVIRYFPILFIQNLSAKLYTAFLYEQVLKRTISMEQAGGFPYFAMEAYLPGVKKGVIGGTSNTMWGTLYYRLPFFNCVDILSQKRNGKNKLYGNKRADKYLELNLQYFMIPYCNGRMEFDETLWSIPSDGSRSGDLIKELRREILEVRKQS